MSFLLHHIARYAAQKLASDPRARETAAKVARIVVDEGRHIARRDPEHDIRVCESLRAV